jgi:hypothetical protein
MSERGSWQIVHGIARRAIDLVALVEQYSVFLSFFSDIFTFVICCEAGSFDVGRGAL